MNRKGRMKRNWLVLIASLSVIVGCSSLRPATGLPFPVRPELHWSLDSQKFCLSNDEGVALGKWFDKVEAFKHAYERLK